MAPKTGLMWTREAPVAATSWFDRLRGVVLRNPEPASRSYRYMARLIELEFQHQERGLCIGVSSPDGNRYSTEAMLMLAYCLQSELGSRVLVVDSRPVTGPEGITERLGLGETPGFVDALKMGPGAIADSAVPSAISGVDVMPNGSQALANTFQGRDDLAAFVRGCAERYDHVLLQVGPVVKDTRNVLVATAADVVLLIARENKSMMADLKRYQEVLNTNGALDVRIVVKSGS